MGLNSQHSKKKMSENKALESYLKRLQELDKEINDNSNSDELMEEVNKIIAGISTEIETESVKKNLTPDLKYINTSNNPDPEFSHEGDSGFDLRAFITGQVIIPPLRVRTIPTGLYFEVEKGLEVQVRSRSGLADKYYVFVLNSPGTIDSRYRGEAKIILANFGVEDFVVNNGDRIAQGVVCSVYGEGKLNMKKVEKLSETKRNTDGFGSTGVS